MFQDVTLKPLLTEESYTLHGKEAQHFLINKLYTAARRGDKFRELVQDVCPLRELELGNTTCPPCPQKGKVAIFPSRR